MYCALTRGLRPRIVVSFGDSVLRRLCGCKHRRFEEVAACYMQETKEAFETERAAWTRSLLAEEQRMAAHGRHQAETERNLVESQMMEAFKQHAVQQSTLFEEAGNC